MQPRAVDDRRRDDRSQRDGAQDEREEHAEHARDHLIRHRALERGDRQHVHHESPRPSHHLEHERDAWRVHRHEQRRGQAIDGHPAGDDQRQPPRAGKPVDHQRHQDPSHAEPGEEVPEALRTGAELRVRQPHEQHRVGAVNEARQHAEHHEHAGGSRGEDRAHAHGHLLEHAGRGALGDVHGPTARPHPRNQNRGDAERRRVHPERQRRRPERQQSRPDRRPRDHHEVVDRSVQGVGRHQVVLPGELRQHRRHGRVVDHVGYRGEGGEQDRHPSRSRQGSGHAQARLEGHTQEVRAHHHAHALIAVGDHPAIGAEQERRHKASETRRPHPAERVRTVEHVREQRHVVRP